MRGLGNAEKRQTPVVRSGFTWVTAETDLGFWAWYPLNQKVTTENNWVHYSTYDLGTPKRSGMRREVGYRSRRNPVRKDLHAG